MVDELAHSNAAGSPRVKRWEDVQVLLDSGIDVLTTMNVHDLASLTDQIWQITGLRVRETVPDWVFQQADEVVMVDVTPRALLHRLERGAIYPPERTRGEAEQVFQEPRLVALRELAIRQTAQALEARGPKETRQTESARRAHPGPPDSGTVHRDAVAPCAPGRGLPAGRLRGGVRAQPARVFRGCRRQSGRRSSGTCASRRAFTSRPA